MRHDAVLFDFFVYSGGGVILQTIRTWIIGICAGAIICAIAQTVAPKSRSGSAVKLACGFMTAALLIGPIKSFDFQQYALSLSEIKGRGGMYAQNAMVHGGDMLKSVIEEQSETYILDKAEELGIQNAFADVYAATAGEGEYPLPYSVELGGEAELGQRKKLSAYIEGELGIPAVRQYWSGEDEN